MSKRTAATEYHQIPEWISYRNGRWHYKSDRTPVTNSLMPLPVITVVGSLNVDLITQTSRIPAAGETLTAQSFVSQFGGKGNNQATACARLTRQNDSLENYDVEVKMVGMVGSDTYGDEIRAPMRSNGIDTDDVWRIEGQATGVAVVIVEQESGESRILLSPNANHCMEPKHFESIPGPVPSLLVLQLEIPLPTVLQILTVAKEQSIPIILNPAPAVTLPKEAYEAITHLILNETEVEILSEAAKVSESLGTPTQSPAQSTPSRIPMPIRPTTSLPAQDVNSQALEELTRKALVFHSLGVEVVIITLGSQGVFVSFGNHQSHFPAEQVDVVDATGAGDTFVGAYAVAIARYGTKVFSSNQILSAVKWANHCASKAVEQLGAQSSIPWIHQVRSFQLEDLV